MKRHFAIIHVGFAIVAALLLGVILVEHFSGRGGSQTERSRERLSQADLQAMSKPGGRARAARNWGQRKRVEAAPLLILYARDPDPGVREACVWALGEIESANAILALRERLGDRDPVVRVAAVEAIGKLAKAHTIADAYPLIREAVTGDDIDLRVAAVGVFASLSGGDATEGLLLAVAEGQPEVVRRAAIGAATSRTDDVGYAVLRAAAKDASAELRLSAVSALAASNDDKRTPVLAAATLDPDARIRAAATAAAREAGTPVVDALRTQIRNSPQRGQLLTYANLLDELDAPTLVPDILYMLDGIEGRLADADAIQERITALLVARGAAALPEVIAAALDGECHTVAERAAIDYVVTLGRDAVPAVVASILQWRLFPSPDELKLWVEALGRIGDPAAVPALEFARSQEIDGMDAIVENARLSIEKKSGNAIKPIGATSILSALANGALLEGPDPIRPTVITLPDAWNGIPDNGVVRIHLKDAVRRQGKGGGREDLTIELRRRNRVWMARVTGFALSYNKRMHIGVLDVPAVAVSASLRVRMAVLRDSWVAGGYGDYTIVLPTDSAPAATYAGMFDADDVAGPATAVSWSEPPPQEPIASGGYPRMIFRHEHLDHMRARLATPVGRQVLAALRARGARAKLLSRLPVNWVTNWQSGMDMAIAFGFLGQVFDDPVLGRRAVEALLKRAEIPPYPGEHGEGLFLPLPYYPYGYDMAHAFMTDEERLKVRTDMASFNGIYTFRGGMMGDLSGMTVHIGTTAMALYDEPGPLYWPEPPATMTRHEPAPLAPDDIPPDAAINTYQPFGLMLQWLVAGPYPAAPATGEADRGAELARAGAIAGQAPVSDMPERAWQPIDAQALVPVQSSTYRHRYFRLPGASADTITYLHAYVRVSERTVAQLVDSMPFTPLQNRTWINGTPITASTAMIMPAGVYRILVEVRGTSTSPYWVALDSSSAIGEAMRYEIEHAAWQEIEREHSRTGNWTYMTVPAEMARAKMLCQFEGAGPQRPIQVGTPCVLAAWNVLRAPIIRPVTIDVPSRLDPGSPVGAVALQCAALSLGLLTPQERAPLLATFRRMLDDPTAGGMSSRELIAILAHWPAGELGDESK